jgi:phosphoribosylformylglycinamidine (FGAM) synthase-like enzyme
VGAAIDIGVLAEAGLSPEEVLFSESHGRFLVSAGPGTAATDLLEKRGVPYFELGRTGGRAIRVSRRGKSLASLGVDSAADAWSGHMGRLME